MEALALLFAGSVFAALIWPEKQPPPPEKKEDLLVNALKELMREGVSAQSQGEPSRSSGR